MASTQRHMKIFKSLKFTDFACISKGGGSGFSFTSLQAGNITAQGTHSASF